jgi:hypothetical protein
MNVKSLLMVRCAFVGHEVNKSEVNKLFSDSVAKKEVECRLCNTPLILTKSEEVPRKYSIKEKYWVDE